MSKYNYRQYRYCMYGFILLFIVLSMNSDSNTSKDAYHFIDCLVYDIVDTEEISSFKHLCTSTP